VTGTIVLLNGAPRSGKSSIARAMQDKLDGVWINLGVDAAMAMQPAATQPGIGLRPGGERPDLEPVVQQLYGALFDAIAAYARAGVNVVSDLGIHDAHSRPLGILADAVRRLDGLPVLFVGIRAPIETIMTRRNADPRGGYYEAGTDVPAPVLLWQGAPHAHGVYDLEIDTSVTSPTDAAGLIGAVLRKWPTVTAFEKLRAHG
jgi:chloramphenicol 3-O phosphotransferase